MFSQDKHYFEAFRRHLIHYLSTLDRETKFYVDGEITEFWEAFDVIDRMLDYFNVKEITEEDLICG